MTPRVPDRILITGSQTWKDRGTINQALAEVWWEWGCPSDAVMVSGGCPRGGDLLCEEAWDARGYLVERHRPRWHEHGPDCPPSHEGLDVCMKAGFRRDGVMVDLGARRCLAFIDVCVSPKCSRKKPHGSHGASKTAALAKAAGIETTIYKSGWS